MTLEEIEVWNSKENEEVEDVWTIKKHKKE